MKYRWKIFIASLCLISVAVLFFYDMISSYCKQYSLVQSLRSNYTYSPKPIGPEWFQELQIIFECDDHFLFERIEGLYGAPMDISPEEISDLKYIIHLKYLNLDSCWLSNIHLQEIGNLHNLKDLSLISFDSRTILDESVPFRAMQITDAGLKYLDSLTQLEYLDLSNNKNMSGEGLIHLKRLPKLKIVNLSYANITDAGMLKLTKLPHLEAIYLPGTQITDAGLIHLKNRITLKGIDLSETQITETGLANLQGMKDLRVLLLKRIQITDSGLAYFKISTHLVCLDLSYTEITDAGLAHLKNMSNLEKLDLIGTQITDKGLLHLHGLSSLKFVNLSESKVTDQGIKALQKVLPNCKIKLKWPNS